jgi:hypothetical protein
MPLVRVKLYYESWPTPVELVATAATGLAGSGLGCESDFSTAALIDLSTPDFAGFVSALEASAV